MYTNTYTYDTLAIIQVYASLSPAVPESPGGGPSGGPATEGTAESLRAEHETGLHEGSVCSQHGGHEHVERRGKWVSPWSSGGDWVRCRT